jgi:CheY-like chemotaxis protein
MRILWADDQITAARSLSGVLPGMSHEIVYVEDGEKALEQLRQEAFDVVVLDLLMPPGEWGGLWFLEQLQKLNLRPPVLVVSGEGSQTETIRAIRLGARDYVIKDRVEFELAERLGQAVYDNAFALLKAGESYQVEFKSSARWDVKESRVNREMEAVILRTVAAFLNSESGGNLFIGVQDDGSVVGLSKDYQTLGQRPNRDGFENWFVGRIAAAFGSHIGRFLRISFPEIESRDVCHIAICPSPTPVYVDERGSDQMYIRVGNSTRLLSAREAVEYCRQRWL